MKLLLILFTLSVLALPFASLFALVRAGLQKERGQARHCFFIFLLSSFLLWLGVEIAFGSSALFAPARQENDYSFFYLALVLLASCITWTWFIRVMKYPGIKR